MYICVYIYMCIYICIYIYNNNARDDSTPRPTARSGPQSIFLMVLQVRPSLERRGHTLVVGCIMGLCLDLLNLDRG